MAEQPPSLSIKGFLPRGSPAKGDGEYKAVGVLPDGSKFRLMIDARTEISNFSELVTLFADLLVAYLKLAGRPSGQTAYGGVATGEFLTLYGNTADGNTGVVRVGNLRIIGTRVPTVAGDISLIGSVLKAFDGTDVRRIVLASDASPNTDNSLIWDGTVWVPSTVNLASANAVQGVLAPTTGGTGITVPGVAGNILLSNGTIWVTVAMSGDVTITGAGVTAIGANKVTRAMQAQGVARSVIGVAGNATANEADIQAAATPGLVLNVNSGANGIGWTTLLPGAFAASTDVPLTAMADQAAYTALVNNTSSAAAPTAVLYTDITAIGVCEGRLTLTTATAVTIGDVTGATTMYFTPYKGARVGLYDGTRWRIYTFTERSLALGTLTTLRPYDVFLYDNAGTLTLEFTSWTSDTARATALVLQDGVYVRSGATTRRYLGTFRTTSTTTTEDSATKRFVWNMYNRNKRYMQYNNVAVHTYNSATQRQWNASSSAQVEFVQGLFEDWITSTMTVFMGVATASVNAEYYFGQGVNSSTGMAVSPSAAWKNDAIDAITGLQSVINNVGRLGYTFIAALEQGNATVGIPVTQVDLRAEIWS